MRARKLERWSPYLVTIGALTWAVCWILITRTVDGTVAVLGLSERGWRRVLDPATLLLMIGLLGLHRRSHQRYPSLGFVAFLIAQVGLAVALIGNVIEFWIGEWIYVDVPGEFEPTDHIGWAVFGLGTALAVLGLAVWGAAGLIGRTRERR